MLMNRTEGHTVALYVLSHVVGDIEHSLHIHRIAGLVVDDLCPPDVADPSNPSIGVTPGSDTTRSVDCQPRSLRPVDIGGLAPVEQAKSWPQ